MRVQDFLAAEAINYFERVVASIYKADIVRSRKKRDFSKAVGKENPFFSFGSMQTFVVVEGNVPLACATAIIDTRLVSVGFVGFFECASKDAAKALLEAIVVYFRVRGIKKIVGPVNQSIWHDYRFTVESDGSLGWFLGEPCHFEQYPLWWQASGWQKEETFFTGLREEFSEFTHLLEKGAQAARATGVRLEAVSAATLPTAMRQIYTICLSVFNTGSYFVPIGFKEFLGLYREVGEVLNSRYCHIAYLEEAPVGFCFSYVTKMENKNYLILKTIGVLLEYQGKHIGALLLHEQHQHALEDNLTGVVYALMREGIAATKIAPDGSRIVRRYQTFSFQI